MSPQEKNGFDVASTGMDWTSPSGDVTAIKLRGVAPGSTGGRQTSVLKATRDDGSGWSSEVVDVERPEPLGLGWSLVSGVKTSPVAQEMVFQTGNALTPDATDPAPQLYLRDGAGQYSLLTPRPGPFFTSFPFDFALGQLTTLSATTADLDRILFETPIEQTDLPVAPSTYSPYMWVQGEGVRLIGILPDDECGAPPCLPASGARIGTGDGVSGGEGRFTATALSRDGSRVYFYVPPSPFGNLTAAGQLYLRDDHGTDTTADDTTTHVSASQRTDCAGDVTCGGDGEADPSPDPAGPLPALFWGAERTQGDKAIFTSCEQLTDDSTASSADPSAGCDAFDRDSGTLAGVAAPGRDLYLFDRSSGKLIDLTTADSSGADVYGVVGHADDLSRIYFVAAGVLAPGGVDGASNLYEWQDGSITHVVVLTSDLNPPASRGGGNTVSDKDNRSYGVSDGLKSTRTSASGEHLVFTSRAPLTGYDNVNATACPADAGQGWNLENRCSQVFLWDAVGGELTCVSCDPSGAPPAGDALLHDGQNAGFGSQQMAINMTEDGSRVYFQTASGLVTPDSNGRQDVYQWEREGSGSCTAGGPSGGCLSLISAGTGSAESFFAGATPSGDSVFFHTYDRLTSSDTDDQRDLYVARVGGGFVEPALPAAPCREDQCQGRPTGPPALVEPGSSALEGEGNVTQGPRASFRVAKLGARRGAALARGRRVTLRVRVNRPGRVTATVRARFRGKSIKVASTSKRASRAGTLRLRIKLSKAARRRVTRVKARALVIRVRFAGAPDGRTLTLKLRRAS